MHISFHLKKYLKVSLNRFALNIVLLSLTSTNKKNSILNSKYPIHKTPIFLELFCNT